MLPPSLEVSLLSNVTLRRMSVCYSWRVRTSYYGQDSTTLPEKVHNLGTLHFVESYLMENVFCHRTSTDVYQLMAVQIIAVNSNSLAQFNVPESVYVQSPQCPKRILGNRSIRKTNIKLCKITCKFKLDFRSGKAESDIEFNSTLNQ